MSELNLDKISRVLLQPVKNLTLKIHVKLLNEKDGRKENFHHIFNIDGNKYLKLDLQSFLTLECTEGDWSKDKTIIINQKNIFQIIKKFEKLLKNIYDGGVFAIDKNDDIVIYSDMVEKYTEKIFNLTGGQRIIAKPAIIYDENDVSYEGVILFINKTENYIELPIDAFEALCYTLKQTNLFVYSQLLVNYYVSTLRKSIEAKETDGKEFNNKKHHPLFVEKKEDVKCNIFKKQTNEEFFNMKK